MTCVLYCFNKITQLAIFKPIKLFFFFFIYNFFIFKIKHMFYTDNVQLDFFVLKSF